MIVVGFGLVVMVVVLMCCLGWVVVYCVVWGWVRVCLIVLLMCCCRIVRVVFGLVLIMVWFVLILKFLWC